MAFELPTLPYASDALEPFYDKETIEIHHGKHHKAYTDNFNKALDAAGISGQTIEEILTSLDSIPADKRTPIINHGGGYYNHTFFWESMAPGGSTQPSDALAGALSAKFGSVDAFLEAFSAKAMGHFGSGWAWLVIDGNGELQITDTHDQVCPLSFGHTPLLTIDVWEHAYYLKYRNVRAEWIKAFGSIINWAKVSERYAQATA
jgi:Fe-Mn family superoxide dismutase